VRDASGVRRPASGVRRGKEIGVLLLVPVVLIVPLALARGGSLQALVTLLLRVRGTGVLLAALAVQVALYLPPLRTAPLVAHAGGALYVVSLGLVAAGALANWRLGPAARVAILGVVLNMTVIVANGGYMPVSAVALRMVRGARTVREITDGHMFNNAHLATSATRLGVLSDVIPVRIARGLGNVYSVGDILLALGVMALIYQAMRHPGDARTSHPRPHHKV